MHAPLEKKIGEGNCGGILAKHLVKLSGVAGDVSQLLTLSYNPATQTF